MHAHTPRSRDAALRRLASLKRLLIAGSAVLTGIFTAIAASAFPGRTITQGAATAGSGGTTGTQAHSRRGSPAGSATRALQPPEQAPEGAEEAPSGQTRAGEEPPIEEETYAEEEPYSVEGPAALEREAESTPASEPEPAGEPEVPVISGGS